MSASELFIYSFDGIATADLANEFPVAGSGLQIVAGRNGNGIKGTVGGTRIANTFRSHPLSPFSNGGFEGKAVYYDSLPLVDTDLISVLDAAGLVLLTFVVTPLGKIKVYRGDSTTGVLIFTTTNVMVFALEWRFLEVGWSSNPVAGTVEIRSTEFGEFPVTDAGFSLNTGGFTPAWSAFEWHLLDGIVIIDDLYVTDNYGGGTFKGDSEILCSLMDTISVASNHPFLAAGWIPNTGSDKVAVLNDATPDGDLTFLYALILTIAYYYIVPIVDSRDVTSVQMTAVAKKISSLSTRTVYVNGNNGYPPMSTSYQAIRRNVFSGADTIASINANIWGITAF